MRPVFLKPSQIDRKRWDHLVSTSGNGNFYCHSWYLDAICKEWNALVLGDYDYILPIPTKSKGFFKILYQPFFSRQLDIIGPEPANETLLKLFLDALPKNYGQVMIGLSELNDISISGYTTAIHPYQELSLEHSLENLRSAYSENASRIIKKLNSAGIVYKDVPNETMVKLFTDETAGKIEHMKSADLTTLQRLTDSCSAAGFGRSIGAFSLDGELLAAGYFIIYPGVICYLKGASTENGKKNGAMYGIMDQVIAQYSTTHGRFDFGGSKIPSIAAFFRKFGATDRYYTFLQKDQPFLIHLSKQLYHKLSR